jgi:hypothetical protein
MVGLSMAVTIGICIGGFAVVYAGLAPYLTDLVPLAMPTATRAPARGGEVARTERTPTPRPTATEAEPTPAPPVEPTPTSTTFAPTHQISAGESVNLRPDPSTLNPAIVALPNGTLLQFLNEDAPSDDGLRWMRFQTEDDQVGWVREIDVSPYQP